MRKKYKGFNGNKNFNKEVFEMEIVTREMTEGYVSKLMKKIETLEPGSKEHQNAVEDLSKLLHSLNEDDRNQSETAVKQDQLLEQRKNRELEESKSKWWNRLTIAGLGFAAFELGIDVVCYLWGLNWEETGTIRSPQTRQKLTKLFRKHEPPKTRF